jgi:hypothetical protein
MGEVKVPPLKIGGLACPAGRRQGELSQPKVESEDVYQSVP